MSGIGGEINDSVCKFRLDNDVVSSGFDDQTKYQNKGPINFLNCNINRENIGSIKITECPIWNIYKKPILLYRYQSRSQV